MSETVIREEKEADYRKVEELTKKAFWNVNVPGCEEHYLLHCMRNHKDFIPELDLVLETDGKIIGHVAYVKAHLVDEEGNEKEILTFGPLSVHPEYQRKGYGKRLLKYSFEKAQEMGYDVIAIFGNPENYFCIGFKSAKKYNVSCGEDRVFPVAFLVKELKAGVLQGKSWTYKDSEALSYDSSKVEEFDKDFEYMEKAYRPSQELFYIYSKSSVIW